MKQVGGMGLAVVWMVTMMVMGRVSWGRPYWRGGDTCLSWRLAVEANDVGAWPTVPPQCMFHVQAYLNDGQYDQDVRTITQHIIDYVHSIVPSGDGKDAWILDVDDTCISNLDYYKRKRYG